MLLIPTGTEAGELNRMPYVTFGIIGVCVAVYLLRFFPGDTLEDVWPQILTYYSQRDYLEIPDALADHPRGQVFYNALIEFSDQKSKFQDDYEEMIDVIGESPRGQEKLDALLGKRRSDLTRDQLRSEQEYFNSLVARLIETLDGDMNYKWGFIPSNPNVLTTITYLFLHADFWHLIGNMLFFYCTAPFVENRWGRGVFLGFFLLSGSVAALMYMFHYPDMNGPLIGASGAISAVMGAFLILFNQARLRFLLVLWLIFFPLVRSFYARVWIVVPIFFMLDLLFAGLGDLLGAGNGGGVAYWAHVWGFVFGLLIALGLKMTRLEKKINPMGIDLNDPDHNPIAAADRHIAKGNTREAFQGMAHELENNSEFSDLAYAYWERVLEHGNERDLNTAGLRLLRFSIGRGDSDQACYFWTQLQEKLPGFSIPPALALKFAKLLAKDPDADEIAYRVLLAAFKRSPRISTPQLVAMARTASRLHDGLAHEIASKALSMDDLTDRDRTRLRTMNETGDQSSVRKTSPADSVPWGGSRPAVTPWKRETPLTIDDSETATIDLSPMEEDPEIETIAPRSEAAAVASSTSTTYANETSEIRSGAWAQPDTSDADLTDTSNEDALPVISDLPKIKAVEVVPEQFSRQGVHMMFPYQKKRKVKFEQFHAVAMGAIKQEGSKPFLVIDLVLDRLDYPREQHRVLRMYSTQFNPMKLFPEAKSASQAFFSFVNGLVKYSRSYTWPSQDAVIGRTPVHYTSIEDFEAKVYGSAVY